jgi:hypothetical protein
MNAVVGRLDLLSKLPHDRSFIASARLRTNPVITGYTNHDNSQMTGPTNANGTVMAVHAI